MTTASALLAASLSLALGSAVLLAQDRPTDWPSFRGPKGMAVSKAKGLPDTWDKKENVAWTAKLPGPGTSSPIVVGDAIYLTYYSGYNVPGERGNMDDLKRHLVKLKLSDGTVIWDKKFDAKLPEQKRIRDDHGYASSTPAADKDHVYCFFGKSGVYAFTHDGKEVWRADVGTRLSDWGSAACPVLYGDLVIVNASVESDSLVALDRKTGKEEWRAKGIRESWNTPILVPLKGDKVELAVAIFGKVLGFDPKTGKQLWSCDTAIPWYMVPSLVADDGVVYCVGGRNGGGALAVRVGGSGDVTDSHRLWTLRKGGNVSSPVFHDGHLYWMNEGNRTAYCVEATKGKVVYSEKVPGRYAEIYSSALLADGKLYYTSRDGKTIVLKAGPKFEKVALNDLNDRSLFHASPAVSGGKLLIRSDKNLYCLEKK